MLAAKPKELPKELATGLLEAKLRAARLEALLALAPPKARKAVAVAKSLHYKSHAVAAAKAKAAAETYFRQHLLHLRPQPPGWWGTAQAAKAEWRATWPWR